MSVQLTTSLGSLTVELFSNDCPKTAYNFLKLCKVNYYDQCVFHSIQSDFIAQSGDPSATGQGGESIYGLLKGDRYKYFEDEILSHLKHTERGCLSMANAGAHLNGSQFFITLAENISSLDGRYTTFGKVVEGLDVLDKLNEVYCDSEHRPFKNIRIKSTDVLADPFDDPENLQEVKDALTKRRISQPSLIRLDDDEHLGKEEELTEEMKEELRQKEAKTRALTLEMIGDLPTADIKPPEHVLFVCRLNPVTRDDDLKLIFSRFGEINSCEIIRDTKTKQSLCYAFIDYKTKESCEEAYLKMENVLIDDRRIHVDFSQSVSRLHSAWKEERKGGSKRRGENNSSIDESGIDMEDSFLQQLAEHMAEQGRQQKSDKYRRNDDLRRDYSKDHRHESRHQYRENRDSDRYRSDSREYRNSASSSSNKQHRDDRYDRHKEHRENRDERSQRYRYDERDDRKYRTDDRHSNGKEQSPQRQGSRNSEPHRVEQNEQSRVEKHLHEKKRDVPPIKSSRWD